MPRKRSLVLTDHELRLMEVLWTKRRATVSEVTAALPPPTLAYNTVLSTLRTLEQKGYVAHKEIGRSFTYRPLVERTDAAKSAVNHVLARFFKHPEIPVWLRFTRFMNLFLNPLNWIFLPVLLLFGFSVPIWISTDFSLTDLGQTLWGISSVLLGVTLSTVLFFLYFEIRILPPKPANWPLWKKGAIYLQYFLYPIVGIVLSVLPALEAHTRLLLGRYLEYRVTEKV